MRSWQDVASRRWLPTRWGRWGRWSQALALFALITVLRSCAHAVALDVVGIDLPGSGVGETGVIYWHYMALLIHDNQ